MTKTGEKGGPEVVQVPDRILTPNFEGDLAGNVAMLLRAATITARKGTTVEVEYVDDHPQGPMVVRREISKIVVHGSGNITLHLKD